MRRGVSLGVALVSALLLAGAAHAAYGSARLTVVNASKRVGGGGPLTVALAQTAGDDATARIVTYVPRGYVSSLVPRVGAPIGTARASLQAGSRRFTAAGALRAADPARHRAGAEDCVGRTARLDAVYVLELDAGGRRVLELPVYVRTVTSGAEARYASGALSICLPAPPAVEPDEPAPRPLSLTLTFRGLFANPATAGAYRWRSLWTPYRDGSRAPDATVEAQALDVLPAQLTLATGRWTARKRTLFVGGGLLENRRPGVGASVELLAGKTPRGVRRVALARTNANGNYGGALRLPAGTWHLRARATVRGRTAGGCSEATVPGVRCLRTTTSGYTISSRLVRAVVPAR